MLEWLVDELKAELIAQKHVATGAALQSLHMEEVEPGREYIITGAKSLVYVNYGTRPHFPPLEPIRRWLQAIGVDVRAAFPIARRMAIVGTPMQPYVSWHEGNTLNRKNFAGIVIDKNKKRIEKELITGISQRIEIQTFPKVTEI